MERGSPAQRPPLFPSASSAAAYGLDRRTLERLRHLGLDEKSLLRGQSYVSVMADLKKEAPRVPEVCDGRKTGLFITFAVILGGV